MGFDPGGSTGHGTGAAAPKRLYRKREGEMLGGVAAGLADYFQLDVSLVRLIIILLTVLTGGAGIVAYLLAWIVIPEEPEVTPGGRSELFGRGAYPPGGESANEPGAEGQGRTFVGTVEAQPDAGDAGEARNAGSTGSAGNAGDAGDGGGGLGKTEHQRHLLRRRQFLGWALVFVGVWALIDRVFPWFRWDLFWPVVLILAGLALILHASQGRG